ncbi:MAG: transposase [Bacillota bacterium]|nr:transposase [Bacillota bacterium]
MPRVARIKNDVGIYHIMVRSISDVPLFRDSKDKERYLQLIRKYKQVFLFRLYAYCLMSTHAHLAIDSCGADISKIMKSINQSYSAYFNKKYKRHGHVFQDRFKSKLVDTEDYVMTLSVYIHNNPSDIAKYEKCVEKYRYSSLGIYLGILQDKLEILDMDYILGHFSSKKDNARKSYLEFTNRISDGPKKIDIEFKDEGSECRSERRILIRNYEQEKIISFISRYTGSDFNIHVRFNHKHSEQRALFILTVRALCNLSLKEICSVIGNITISAASRLFEKGYALIIGDTRYKGLIDDMVTEFSAA